MGRFPIFLGYGLFLLYLLQLYLPISFKFLDAWQTNESFKRWSGLVLISLIAFQWLLTFDRMLRNKKSSDQLVVIHRWIGAFSPLVFFIHSSKAGFGYLLVLTITFYFNFLLGMINTQVLKNFGNTVFKWWFVSHIIGSVIVTGLAVFHIYLVFYYK